MNTVDGSHDVNVRAYVSALGRQKGLIIAATILGLLLGLAYASLRPDTYSSTATVEVKPLTLQPLVQSLDQRSLATLLATERQVATATTVANLAAQKLRTDEDPQSLLDHLSIQTPGDANILSFVYSSDDRVGARDGAQAFADAYVTVKQRIGERTYEEFQRAIRVQIQSTKGRIDRLDEKIDSSPRAAQPGSAKRTLRTLLVAKLGQLWSESASLTPLVVSPAQVVEPAELPPAPNNPAPAIHVTLGGLLGLAAGSGIALARNRRGGRWHGAADLEEPVGSPVIGLIPKMPRRATKGGRLTTLGDRSAASEAYRQLRAHFLALGSRDVKSLAITSPKPDDGKSTTAANLAVALAQAGKRTILISADFHAPGIDRAFDLSRDRGLSSVLSGEMELGDALQFSGVNDLWILATGPVSDHSADVLRPDALGTLLVQARELVDAIIVDCPPLFAVADALTFASLVDGVALVAHARRTRRGALIRARKELEQVQARVVGIIVNEVPGNVGSNYDAYMRSRRNGSARAKGRTDPSSDARDGAMARVPDATGWLLRKGADYDDGADADATVAAATGGIADQANGHASSP